MKLPRSAVAGLAGAAMLVLLSASPAFAADGTAYVGPPPPSVTTAGPVGTEPVVTVKAETVTSAVRGSGSLPFTGGDVVELTLVGVGMTAVGTGLIIRNRRHRLA